MRLVVASIFTFFIALQVNHAFAVYQKADCGDLQFQEWKECVKLHFQNLEPDLDVAPLDQACYLEQVIQKDKSQPEMKLYYEQYLKLINLEERIKTAKSYLKDNKALLHQIAQKYQVEPEAIVALLALESRFGAVMGSHDIISSLSSLAYDGRRAAFFEQELLNALKIKQNLPEDFVFQGSWAGAMGQCQFMPSSYNKLAIDYSGKGYADIWSNREDIYASIANFLAKSGWKKNKSAIKHMKDGGKNKNLPKIVVIDYSSKSKRTYAVDVNYNALMQWNRSSYFAVTVLTIINALKNA